LVTTPLSIQFTQILLDKITDLSFPPGTRIDIEKLKKEYGVSHIPIRDALHKLSEQGLVTIVPRIGYFTVQFTPVEIRDLFRVRELLELSAISRNVKKMDKELLLYLEGEYTAWKKKPPDEVADTLRFYELSEMLHRDAIIKNAGSPLIESIYTSLLNKIRVATRILLSRLSPPREDIDEHLKIIRALLDENRAEAKKALKQHLIAVQKRTIGRLPATGTPESPR
jgi:DNA-binding GntR family transcriptional regulator